jgi:hypothetical protein
MMDSMTRQALPGDTAEPKTAASGPEQAGDLRSPRVSSAGVSLLLVVAAIAGPVFVWMPFWKDMSRVYRFWDGPQYLATAHDLYAHRPGNPLPVDASKAPLYPLAIRLLSPIGWERAMLAVVVLASIASVLLFYRLARDVWKVRSPAFLSLVFLFFPPRWLLYRSVPASEPLFLALVLASLWYFEKSRVGRASVLAGLASVTRLSGLMILPAYAVLLLRRRRDRSIYWLSIIPAGFAAWLWYCAVRLGDVWAPLQPNLEKAASFLPFDLLNRNFSWPQHYGGEFSILLFLVYGIGIWRLRELPVPFAYCVFQFLFLVFLAEGDLSRYALTMAPFALILGYRDVIDTRAFRWAFPVLAFLTIRWASAGIPFNGCDPEVYARLLEHLGLGAGR